MNIGSDVGDYILLNKRKSSFEKGSFYILVEQKCPSVSFFTRSYIHPPHFDSVYYKILNF